MNRRVADSVLTAGPDQRFGPERPSVATSPLYAPATPHVMTRLPLAAYCCLENPPLKRSSLSRRKMSFAF